MINIELLDRLKNCTHEDEKIQKAYEKLIETLESVSYSCDEVGSKILTMSCEPSTSIYYNFNRLIEINAPIETYDTFIYIANEVEDIYNCLSKAYKFIAIGGDNDTLVNTFRYAKDEKNFINKIDRYNGKLSKKKTKRVNELSQDTYSLNRNVISPDEEIIEYLKTIKEMEVRCEKAERELFGTNLAISKVNAENIALKEKNASLIASINEKDRIIEKLEGQLRLFDDNDSFSIIEDESEDIDKSEETKIISQEALEDNNSGISKNEVLNLVNDMQITLKTFIRNEINARLSVAEKNSFDNNESNLAKENAATSNKTFFSMPQTTNSTLKERIIGTIADKITDYYSKEFDAMSPDEQSIMIRDLSFDKYDEDTTLCIDYCLEDSAIDNKLVYCMVAQNASPIAFNKLAGKAN